VGEEQLNKHATNQVLIAVDSNVKSHAIDKPSFIQSDNKGLNRFGLVPISSLVPQMVIILFSSNKKTILVVLGLDRRGPNWEAFKATPNLLRTIKPTRASILT
jgi:hypothetical protein